MEPVILVDKRKNKETHIIISARNDFGDLIESARRIHTGLFEGAWDLCYLDPNTKKPVILDENEEIGTFLERDINTFYWRYKRKSYKIPVESDQVNKDYRRKARTWTGSTRPEDMRETTTSKQQKKQQEKGAEIQYLEYAHIFKRAFAYFIDALVLGALLAAFKANGLVLIVWWLYFAVLESSRYQGTLGKIALNMKVTDLNGRRINFVQATIRHFAKWLSGLIMGLGYIIALFTEKRQALHDMIASTVVVEVMPTER